MATTQLVNPFSAGARVENVNSLNNLNRNAPAQIDSVKLNVWTTNGIII